MKNTEKVLVGEQPQILRLCSGLTQKWDAYLAGGLGTALQLGHRSSRDFDWFTPKTIPPAELARSIKAMGLPTTIRQNDEGTFLATVGSIDFSVFRYRYPNVSPTVNVAGCELASLRDIGAMKLVAISQRTTMRDYVDLHAITKKIPLREITMAWKKKYPLADLGTPLRALTYFKDIDSDEKQKMPAMLNGVTWNQVKKELATVVERYNSRGIER